MGVLEPGTKRRGRDPEGREGGKGGRGSSALRRGGGVETQDGLAQK